MRILVTGADGFVGARLVRRLLEAGHAVSGTVRPPGDAGRALPEGVRSVPLELADTASVEAALRTGVDAVVHLAAVASGADARQDPGEAWTVNAAGTARVAEALARGGTAGSAPRLLLASTAEVYGAGPARPRRETDAVAPCSPYAASKLGAEVAALEVGRRTGLHVVIARPFPHTGAGQDERFVIPAFARRLLAARATGAAAVEVGNLEPVRDFLHVDDVVEAYVRLLEDGAAGEVYNIASGRGVTIREVFDRLAARLNVRAVPEVDARLVRAADVPHLVGDADKLRTATGWRPARSLDDALREVIGAQAD